MTKKRELGTPSPEAKAVERPFLDARLPDGTMRPITLDEQWQNIESWYQYLCRELDPERDAWLLGLVEQWQAAESFHAAKGKRMKRGAALRGAGPMQAPMFRFIQMISSGVYPPPELLLGLESCFQAYLAGGGELAFEETYFGPVVRGAGNFSRRYASTLYNESVPKLVALMMSKGFKRSDAAEWLATNIYDGKPSAESLTRMTHGVSPARAPQDLEPSEGSFWEQDN